jgi:CHAD domain-containing protein
MSVARLEQPPSGNPALRLEAELDRRIERFEGAALAVRARVDGDALHDLRVSIRRLDAVLDARSRGPRPKPLRRARRALQELRRGVGPTRAREAELERLERLLREEPDAVRRAVAPVLERLSRQIRRGRESAAREASRRRVARILALVERARKAVIPARPKRALSDLRARADAVRSRALTRIAAALESPGEERLHDARIAARRWRYTLETLAAAMDATRETQALGEAQRAAGAALELGALQRRIEKEVARQGEEATAAVQPLLERIVRRRGEALAEWATVARTWAEPAPPAGPLPPRA